MKRVTLSLALLVAATPALALEVVGGSVSLGYSGFTDDLLDDINKTTLSGSLEVGISRAFSVQGDLAIINYGLTDLDANNIGLHGIYHLSETTSIGGYIGQDSVESADLSILGIEAGHQAGPMMLEGYLSRAESSGEDGTIFGLRAAYGLSEDSEIGLRYDDINVDGIGASRISAVGEFGMANGFAITGELGSADIEGIGSETFFGIGVKVDFGAKRGATFSQRSVVDLFPGL
jgi:hypothetical protein